MSTLVALIIQTMYIHYRKRYALIKSDYIHTSWGFFHTFFFFLPSSFYRSHKQTGILRGIFVDMCRR